MLGFPGTIGAIDCTHVKVPMEEGNRAYIDRYSNSSLNVQVSQVVKMKLL